MAILEDTSDIHVLSDREDMLSILQKFQKTRQPLKLYLAGLPDDFTTVILECDWQNQQLVLDQAIAPSGKFDFHRFPVFNLEGAIGGIHYNMEQVRCLSTEGASGESQRVEFPRSICFQQRRKSFRTTVPRGIDNFIELRLESGAKPLVGRILDLSVTGMACECHREIFDNQNFTIEDLKDRSMMLNFTIRDVLTTRCQARLKDALPAKTEDYLRFGLEFFQLDATTQRQIDKAVVDVQRLTRKNQTRV